MDNGNNNYNNYTYNPEPNQQPNYNQNYNYNMPQNTPDAPKGKAIAAMVCGILSIVMCWCYGIVGIALAIVALVLQGSYKKSNGGKHIGFSQAGFICGLIGIILSSLCLIYVIIAFAIVGSLVTSPDFWNSMSSIEYNMSYTTMILR